MSTHPNNPTLPPDVPQEDHLTLKEIHQLLSGPDPDCSVSYEWVRRQFSVLTGVIVIKAKRQPGDGRRKHDKVLVPISVFQKWYDDHRRGGAR